MACFGFIFFFLLIKRKQMAITLFKLQTMQVFFLFIGCFIPINPVFPKLYYFQFLVFLFPFCSVAAYYISWAVQESVSTKTTLHFVVAVLHSFLFRYFPPKINKKNEKETKKKTKIINSMSLNVWGRRGLSYARNCGVYSSFVFFKNQFILVEYVTTL